MLYFAPVIPLSVVLWGTKSLISSFCWFSFIVTIFLVCLVIFFLSWFHHLVSFVGILVLKVSPRWLRNWVCRLWVRPFLVVWTWANHLSSRASVSSFANWECDFLLYLRFVRIWNNLRRPHALLLSELLTRGAMVVNLCVQYVAGVIRGTAFSHQFLCRKPG